MFIVCNEITVTWLLEPTATPLVADDFDIKFTTPLGPLSDYETTYTDAAILEYDAPSATRAGCFKYVFTPTKQGHYRLTLTCGVAEAYLVLDEKHFWVFCAVSTTEPSIEILGVNPIVPITICPECPGGAPSLGAPLVIFSPTGLQADFFGSALDIDDNHLVIGWEDNVRIYDTDGVGLRTINNTDFGTPTIVKIHNNRLLVTNKSYSDGNFGAGRAWIYRIDDGDLLLTIDNPNLAFTTTAFDNFGNSGGINANEFIVGSHQEDAAGGVNSGAAYIFDLSTGGLLNILVSPLGGAGFDFGNGADLSPSYAVIGERKANSAIDGTSASGKIHIYNPSNGALSLTLETPILAPTANAHFGFTIAVNDNHILVGAPGEDPFPASGVAHLIDPSDGSLIHTFSNPNVHGTDVLDRFGEGQDSPQGVALSSKYSIINAWQEDGPAGEDDAGAAYIFDNVTGALLFTLINPNDFNTHNFDTFGRAVGITNTRVAVGAPNEDSSGQLSTGRVYLYTISGG